MCSTNIDLFNGFRDIGAYDMLSLLRFGLDIRVSAKSLPFPIESCTFTPQNGGKVTPDATLIGASLSEPHTYRTAVKKFPYIYVPSGRPSVQRPIWSHEGPL